MIVVAENVFLWLCCNIILMLSVTVTVTVIEIVGMRFLFEMLLGDR